ncbi:MAG: GNAT family N-acetyltransferase [Polyangiales bacterium]
MSDVRVYEPTEVTPALLAAMRALVPLLSSSAPPLTETSLAAILASPGARLLVAERDGAIVGTLTLVLFAIPSGVRGLIEDVIVDERARGRGIGEALTRAALDLARAAGARTVDLTSRPTREAANRLYLRVGFVRRETNAYRFTL